MSHSQFHSTKLFILRHAWLNLWDKHMTTGRINQVTLVERERLEGGQKTKKRIPPSSLLTHRHPLFLTPPIQPVRVEPVEKRWLDMICWISFLNQPTWQHLTEKFDENSPCLAAWCHHPIASLSFFPRTRHCKVFAQFAESVLRWKFQLARSHRFRRLLVRWLLPSVWYHQFSWRINTHEFFFCSQRKMQRRARESPERRFESLTPWRSVANTRTRQQSRFISR